MTDFLAELRRRNVIRMAGLYLVGAWLVVQVAETLLPIFDTPGWVLKALVVLLAIGFVPALVFSWIYELTPDGIRREGEVSPGQSTAPKTAQRMDRLILVALALVVLVVATDRFWPRAVVAEPAAVADTPLQQEAGATDETVATPGNSIAVLPFVNMSTDPEQEYFSDGISEEILNAWSRCRVCRSPPAPLRSASRGRKRSACRPSPTSWRCGMSWKAAYDAPATLCASPRS